jgi:putative glutamine amidotransferase
MVIVALTGRRLGRTEKWPYTGAAALPYRYVEAVLRAGGQPVIVNDARDPKALLGRVEAPHPSVYGVDSADDDFECALAEAALVRSVPTLAICRGIQILNVARGGTLHQHIADDPGVPPHGQPGVAGGAREHQVKLDAGSLVAEVMDATTVTASCHHHQAIAQLGDGLQVVGRAHDGIVEALAIDGAFLLAVQWHPEDTADEDPAQQRLFDALVRRAGG